MSQTAFYLEKADYCARAAAEADLPAVRAKFHAAEQAWRSLAELPTARPRTLKTEIREQHG